MIPFDFVYCRLDTVQEAVDTFQSFLREGKKAVYYAGGSETITMCRTGTVHPDAVIDMKNIPECNRITADQKMVHIGSACTLNQIKESRIFPLLGLACGRIADHTNQCRITLGGNLCGTIIYRETVLPLLLSDAEVTLIGLQGQRKVSIDSVFKGRMVLLPGELITEVHIPVWALNARHAHIKKTTNEKIDYPLVSVAALWKDDVLRVAFSGVCVFPFRNAEMEAILNDHTQVPDIRAEKAAKMLPQPPLTDVWGTGDYRVFVLKNTLCELLEKWENGKI